MAYTVTDYPSKKALREDVKAGVPVTFYQPGPFGTDMSKYTGRVFLEGPHYPKPHSWYADCEAVNGKITKVK